jgi:hypothetical protein
MYRRGVNTTGGWLDILRELMSAQKILHNFSEEIKDVRGTGYTKCNNSGAVARVCLIIPKTVGITENVENV